VAIFELGEIKNDKEGEAESEGVDGAAGKSKKEGRGEKKAQDGVFVGFYACDDIFSRFCLFGKLLFCSVYIVVGFCPEVEYCEGGGEQKVAHKLRLDS